MKTIYVKVEDSTFTPDEDEGDETTNEQDPLVLEGIPVDEFKAFVHASHSEASTSPAPKLAVGSYDYWMDALKLVNMWNFNQVNQVERRPSSNWDPSSKTTPLEMVYLGRKHFVPAWVKAGYVALCSQEDIKPHELASPPCGSSELALDWKTIAMLCFVWGHLPHNVDHEEIECRSCGTGAPLRYFDGVYLECSSELMLDQCRIWCVGTYEDLVSEHFKEELEELGAASDL
ncbi:hypothetical protein CPC08DRAFT_768032 [Agrocybe pediades]|nr:hypothetical protein CPC08DRAFT_768032 [Agrocybe pediades]